MKPDHGPIKHELGRAAGAMEGLGSIRPRDIRRMAKGKDATVKLGILSRDLLPQLCEIIHRGLTLEEIQLLTGTNPDELRAALRKPMIRKTVDISVQETSRDDWVNIAFIVRTDKNGVESPEGLTNGETFLAPAHLVRKRSRYRCYERLSGTLPELYVFRTRTEIEERDPEELERSIEADPVAAGDRLLVQYASLKLIRSVMASPHAPDLLSNLADLFQSTGQRSVHYALRYRALNDLETFQAIDNLAGPLVIVATELMNQSRYWGDPEVRKDNLEEMDMVLHEIELGLDGISK